MRGRGRGLAVLAAAVCVVAWLVRSHVPGPDARPRLRYNLPRSLDERWPVVRLAADDETRSFLADGWEGRSMLNELGARFARRVLRWSRTDANGFFGCAGMFVLSRAQLRRLLPGLVPARGPEPLRVLDVGAGDGSVTARFRADFGPGGGLVSATEASWAMRGRLEAYGDVTVYDPATMPDAVGPYDLVFLLNVLDRVDAPLTILRQASGWLADGDKARVVVALVLPYCPFVDETGTQGHRPSERLVKRPSCRGRFEDGVDAALAALEDERFGLEVESVSRVPYLSRHSGSSAGYSSLDDMVAVLKRRRRQGT